MLGRPGFLVDARVLEIYRVESLGLFLSLARSLYLSRSLSLARSLALSLTLHPERAREREEKNQEKSGRGAHLEVLGRPRFLVDARVLARGVLALHPLGRVESLGAYLTECINQMVLESQLPHNLVVRYY